MQDPPDIISTRQLAAIAHFGASFSVTSLIDTLLAPVTYSTEIVTPSGTALGGSATLTMSGDGSYSFDVHMHDSGWDPYDFRVRCVVQSPGGVAFLFQTSGHTDGTGSDVFGSPNRHFDHHEAGINSSIQHFWLDVRASSITINKSYQDSGVLSTFEDIAKDLLGFLIADVTLGAGLALAVCVSADIANAAGATFVGPGGLVGVVVAGGVVWVFGPSAIIAAVVAGVAAGAVTDALIKHRQLTDSEYAFAGTVFGNTMPPQDRIYVTNLSHGGGRKYTWPELDGSVIMNMGDAYDDPVHYSSGGYPTQGQVFIHEMTHAWQVQTRSFVPGLLCKIAFQTGTYDVGPPGQQWGDYGLEQQGALVDHWFGKYASGWTDHNDLVARLSTAAAIADPFFRYIADNIRLAQD